MTTIPEHVCLLTHVHEPHDWWYTSSGGGHMLDEYDDSGYEKNQKQWHCPGVEAEPVSEEPDEEYVPPTTEDIRQRIREGSYAIFQDEAEFNRWLNEIQRTIWDSAYAVGVMDQARWQKDGIPDGGIRNPYSLEE